MKICSITASRPTQLTNDAGVYQDSVVAYAYDDQKMIWAVLGHTNLGGITVWRGPAFASLVKQHDARFAFSLGCAGRAFNASKYPDGPQARGQIWPCGLWIRKSTNRFYCFFHNETGWGAGDTSYTAFGRSEGEPDFRHIGLMTSDDWGQTWNFVGWILTSHEKSWTDVYPAGMETAGQTGQQICLGCGDFSIWADEQNGYLYIFYTQHTVDRRDTSCVADRVFVARCSLRELDDPSAWRKYNGEGFDEPGNCGRDFVLFSHGAIPSVCRICGGYGMATYDRAAWRAGICTLQLSFSEDLLHWSAPQSVSAQRPDLSHPYFTLVPDAHAADTIHVLMSSNGTGIQQFSMRLQPN